MVGGGRAFGKCLGHASEGQEPSRWDEGPYKRGFRGLAYPLLPCKHTVSNLQAGKGPDDRGLEISTWSQVEISLENYCILTTRYVIFCYSSPNRLRQPPMKTRQATWRGKAVKCTSQWQGPRGPGQCAQPSLSLLLCSGHVCQVECTLAVPGLPTCQNNLDIQIFM